MKILLKKLLEEIQHLEKFIKKGLDLLLMGHRKNIEMSLWGIY